MPASPPRPVAEAHVDLLMRSVTNFLYLGDDVPFEDFAAVRHYDLDHARWKIDRRSCPASLLTALQLEIIRRSVAYVEERGITGDLLEAGVWRGGAVIFMRGLLDVYGIASRKVVAADSFEGIPLNTTMQGDPVDGWADRWVATLDEVKANIARFGMLDDRIEFCVGYFEQSLASLQGRRFAVIRLDSDSHDSVMSSLVQLYPLVSQGGIVIIDDWHLPGCRMAVEAYRAKHGIADPIQEVGGNAYWAKQQEYGQPG